MEYDLGPEPRIDARWIPAIMFGIALVAVLALVGAATVLQAVLL